MIVSFVEMVAWFCYLDGYFQFARFYFRTIGYWTSIFFYGMPFFFEIVQLVLKGSITWPGTWAIYHLFGSLVFWLLAGITHFVYIEDFVSFIDAREPANCVCMAPEVLLISPDADEETKLAWKFAIDQRVVMCDIECPLVELARKCGLKRMVEQSDKEYMDACNAVIIKARQQNRASLQAAEAMAAAESRAAEEQGRGSMPEDGDVSEEVVEETDESSLEPEGDDESW